MSQPSVPHDSPRNMLHERTLLDGIFLGVMAYGVHLTLFVWCMNLLVHKKQKTRMNWFFVFYISMLFILGSIGNATNIKLAEVLYVDKRDYPGGPLAYYATGGGSYNVACNVVYIVNSWFQDGLLLWRFWIFFARQGQWYPAILPGLMFLATVSISLILIVMLCVPGISLWSRISINLAIPYWAISIALNVGITACIVARLLYMRYKTRQVIGEPGAEYCRLPYASVTSMLVESAALYSTNGLTFLVAYILNSPIQNLALPLLGQTQSIAPLLIILRVLQDQAWSSASITKFEHGISDVRFASHGNIDTLESTDTSPSLFARSKSGPFGGSGTGLNSDPTSPHLLVRLK